MGSIKLSIIVMLVSALITCAVAWYCLKKLREIMVPMKDGRPFEAGVGSQIRRLAFTVLIGGGIAEVCRTVANAFEVKAYDLSKLFNPDVVKGISFDYDISLGLWSWRCSSPISSATVRICRENPTRPCEVRHGKDHPAP